MKEATFFYATVVAEDFIDDPDRQRLGEHVPEPIRVMGKEPLGKNPEYCCPSLENLITHYGTVQRETKSGMEVVLAIPNYPYPPLEVVNFCPFCGARFVFEKNLDVKVRHLPETHISTFFEIA